VAGIACGEDNITNGDTDQVTFPTIDPNIIALFCIRGTAVPPRSVSGSVSPDDCHSGEVDDGYWETWRVRVASTASVTFTVSSQFDSWLTLIRVDDLNDIVNSTYILDEDDDSAGNFQAQIVYTLQPNTEYIVSVSGYDDSEGGSYTLQMSI
jgi:hypothetical protein